MNLCNSVKSFENTNKLHI